MALLDAQRESLHKARKRKHEFGMTPKWKTVPLEATVATLNRKTGKKGTTTKQVGTAATVICTQCGVNVTAFVRMQGEKQIYGYFGGGINTDCTPQAREKYADEIAWQARFKKLIDRKSRLWTKMRQHEGIHDREGMLAPRDDNPFLPEYNKTIEELQQMRRQHTP